MANKKKKVKKENKNPIAKSRNRTPQEWYEMGKTRYIWGHGVLSWGIATGVIFMILTGIHQYRFAPRLILGHIFSPSGLLTIAMFGAVGLIWGSFMWRIICRKVEKQHSEDKKHNSSKKK